MVLKHLKMESLCKNTSKLWCRSPLDVKYSQRYIILIFLAVCKKKYINYYEKFALKKNETILCSMNLVLILPVAPNNDNPMFSTHRSLISINREVPNRVGLSSTVSSDT